jgi:copper transport protein
LAAILPVWSSWAMLAVVTLVMTGIAQSLIEVASVSALFSTGYGRLVLAKATLLVVVVAVAWYSRRLVGAVGAAEADRLELAAVGAQPSGGRSGATRNAVEPPGPDPEEVAPGPARRLRHTVLAELAITGVILGLAAALVQSPPARSAADPVSQSYAVTLTSDLYVVRLELFPAKVGANTMHLYAFDNAGRVKNVLEWKVTAVPTDGSVEPLTIPILQVAADHVVAEPTFPSAGEWELRLTLRVSDVDQSTVSQKVTLRA